MRAHAPLKFRPGSCFWLRAEDFAVRQAEDIFHSSPTIGGLPVKEEYFEAFSSVRVSASCGREGHWVVEVLDMRLEDV